MRPRDVSPLTDEEITELRWLAMSSRFIRWLAVIVAGLLSAAAAILAIFHEFKT